MRLKFVLILAVLTTFAVPAWSQNDQPVEQLQVSAIGTVNIQPTATDAGVTVRATKSGGIVFTGRYHWRGGWWFEANGGFTTFTQYYEPVGTEEQANIYEGTGGLVYAWRPQESKLRPFVELAGGVEYFSPVATGSTGGGQKQVRPTGIAGIGADYRMGSHLALRFGYRAALYKPASFNVASQTLNTYTVMSEPFLGLALRF